MTDQCDGIRLARVVAQTMNYETLPDFELYQTAGWAIRDTIKREAGL